MPEALSVSLLRGLISKLETPIRDFGDHELVGGRQIYLGAHNVFQSYGEPHFSLALLRSSVGVPSCSAVTSIGTPRERRAVGVT